MKDLLYISPFFYPEPISTGKYNTDLVVELRDHADSVDVLCSHPIYPQWNVELSEKTIEGVNIIRGGALLRFPKNVLLRRLVLELWFFQFVFKHLAFSKKKYSHIFVVFPPSLFMLIVRFFSKNAHVIGIVHDLQGVYAKKESSVVKSVVSVLISKVESRSFSNCDQLVFLSEDMKAVAVAE